MLCDQGQVTPHPGSEKGQMLLLLHRQGHGRGEELIPQQKTGAPERRAVVSVYVSLHVGLYEHMRIACICAYMFLVPCFGAAAKQTV